MAGIGYTSRDRDLLIRTIMGEANNEPYLGKAGVAHTILNRVRTGGYGDGIEGVIMRPKQFEPWTTRRDELLGYGPQTKGWDSAVQVADAVLSGQLPDPTKGATHFANIATVQQRGDPAGREGGWLSKMGNRTVLGRHTFGNADAGRIVEAGKPVQPFVLQGGATPGANTGQGPTVSNAAALPVQPSNTTPAQPVAPPPAIREGGGLVGLAMQDSPVTKADVKSFLGGAEMKGAMGGLSMIAQGMGGGSAPAAPPPPQIEDNRPDMSLLEMIGKRKKKAMV